MENDIVNTGKYMGYCRACDAPVTQLHAHIEDGVAYDTGLCSRCYRAGADDRDSDDWGHEILATHADREPNADKFVDFVVKHNLADKWADGLGLMEPMARYKMLVDIAWTDYLDALSLGFGQVHSLRIACRMAQRGDQQNTFTDAID